MKWKDTVASRCRWSEFAEEEWADWDFIWERSEDDYQGQADFVAFKDGKFVTCSWVYGSCSGCDGWEDLDRDVAKADFMNGALFFDSIQDVAKWAINYSSADKSKEVLAALRNNFEDLLNDEVVKMLTD